MEEFESAKVAFNEAINTYYDTEDNPQVISRFDNYTVQNFELKKPMVKKHESSLKQFNFTVMHYLQSDNEKNKLKKVKNENLSFWWYSIHPTWDICS